MVAWRAAFPKTIEALQRAGLARYIEGFDYELNFNSMRLDLRWFPVFLKMQNTPARLLELAEFEFLRAQAYSTDLGLARLENGILGVNPSAQFMEVHETLTELGRGPGLYCFVKNEGRFFEMELTLAQALLVDLLHEERKYTQEQLIDQAMIHPVQVSHSRKDWAAVLATLVERGVIQQGVSAQTLHDLT